MGTFEALIGDMFASPAQTLVNTVNCVGVMGKGVALKFKEIFPEMYEDYARRCTRNAVRLGEPYVYDDPKSGRKILNFPTKDHWRSPSRVKDIERGLDYLVGHYEEWGIASLAMPPLGCGNGGLEWDEIGPLIYRKLHELPISTKVFAPYGTPSTELREEFLSSPAQLSLDGKGRKHQKMNPDWIPLVEVLRQLERQSHARPVGRVIFQKICYVLTVLGVDTGFEFGKGSYGPFSADVMPVLHDFANRNWLREKLLGRMLALTVGEQFERDRTKHQVEIDKHSKAIDKTVDLFSRIQGTEQAEEVVTVLYAARQVKNGNRLVVVDEQRIFDYILEWKKHWVAPEKHEAIADAIRNLAGLGWIRVRASQSMMGIEDCL